MSTLSGRVGQANVRATACVGCRTELPSSSRTRRKNRRSETTTAESTRTSIATVRKISTQAKSSDLITVFKTPGKKRCRIKPDLMYIIINIDNFNQGVIHNFHNTNNELPTVEKLKKKLEEDINYKVREFWWKNTENNRKVLIENSNIRFQQGRPIVYTDECYVGSSHSSQKAWTDGTTKGLKKPISKGQHVVIVQAGSETGRYIIPNALLTFKAGTKSDDYHDKMNFENYGKWLKSQLMPNLPANSVVLFDNASYHNKLWDRAPTSNAKKAAMQAWLTEKGIQYEKTQLKKPQLYNLIKANKERFKTFSIDRILAEQGHQVLRLPPYHTDLNPIKTICRQQKSYSRKSFTDGCLGLAKAMQKGAGYKEQYAMSDHVVDLGTEEFIIQVNGDSSDDSIDESDEDESTSADDRSSPEPGPTTSKALIPLKE
ncbi:hypothetical protein ABMA27_003390 [Loxostege sticticalis]|uniref:Tc1-like transposase DDE domain-containing protein n=1 Tax=Loxostege sticticalis TaxID=481309 RepID=A0ABR3HSZ9_LOXSC